jgi:hypothetical protein
VKARNERLEITISVLATAEIEDDEALHVARSALGLALDELTSRLPCKRFISGICIGEGLIKRHRRVYRASRRRAAALGPDTDPDAAASQTKKVIQ